MIFESQHGTIKIKIKKRGENYNRESPNRRDVDVVVVNARQPVTMASFRFTTINCVRLHIRLVPICLFFFLIFIYIYFISFAIYRNEGRVCSIIV